MLEGLQEELNDSRWSQYRTASNELKLSALNADESALIEAWSVVSDREIKVPTGDLLKLLSFESQLALRDFRSSESDYAKTFEQFYVAHNQFTVTDSVFRGTMEILVSLSVITEAEKNIIMRLGERPISRAEELFGRKLTMEDFES